MVMILYSYDPIQYWPCVLIEALSNAFTPQAQHTAFSLTQPTHARNEQALILLMIPFLK